MPSLWRDFWVSWMGFYKDANSNVEAQMQGEEHMTEWTPEEDEAFNMVEQNSNLGKQILRANKSSGMDCCTYDCTQGRNCPVRNKTLDEVAHEFSLMKSLGDTAQSFAAFVRGMKK